MKNVFKVLGIIALVAVIGFGFVSCGGDDDGGGGGGPKTLSGTITISLPSGVTNAVTGTLLTANYSGSETVTYQWNKDGAAISGAVSVKYTPPEAGSYTVTVSAEGYNSKTSDAVTVTGNPLAKLTGTVSITGAAAVGQTLTANTASLNGSGDISYQWKRGDAANAVNTDINGANGKTYTLAAADKGKYIAVTVMRSGNSGSVTGAAAVQVADAFPEVTATGDTLAAKLSWLITNAASQTVYIVTVEADEDLAVTTANTLSYTGKSYITIRLTGGSAQKTVKLTNTGSLFTVGSGVTLEFGANIALQGNSGNNAPLVMVNSGGTFTMSGGKISGNTVTSSSYSYGGGVYVSSGGTFTMNGGEISGNTVTSSSSYSYGGGVYVSQSSTFTMSGGEISGNTVTSSSSSNGGGVYAGGPFTMSGGKISGNTVTSSSSSSNGGGVYAGGTFTMNGGEISGNTVTSSGATSSGATSYGGGVYVVGTLTMNGGEISGNSSTTSSTYSNGGATSYGGGVCVYGDRGTFTMNGGKISGNSSTSSYSSGSSSYSTSSRGGGVCVFKGTFTMSGGEISGNTSSNSSSTSSFSGEGGGVYVASSQTFTKTGGGTIYGYAEGDPNSNAVKNSGAVQMQTNRGHAVYVASSPAKHRETTAGPTVDLDSKLAGTAGGWEE